MNIDRTNVLPRPRAVTIISWLFVVSGLLSLAGGVYLALSERALALLQDNGIPVWVSVSVTLLSAALYGISGVMMLRGQNAGRQILLYGLLPVMVVSCFFTAHPLAAIPSAVLTGLMILPLYQPLTHRYFLHQLTAEDIEKIQARNAIAQSGGVRKGVAILGFTILGVLIYIVSFACFLNVSGLFMITAMMQTYGLPVLLCYLLSLWLYPTSMRWFAAGLSFLMGASITLFVLLVALNYPLPEPFSELDMKSQFSNFAIGLPVIGFLYFMGLLHVVLGIWLKRKSI